VSAVQWGWRNLGNAPRGALLSHTADLLADPKVRSSTKLVWLYLGTLGKGRFSVNVHEMHRKLGMSRTTVWRALLQLQKEGYIAWDRSGKGGGGWDRHATITITSSR
jgi:hypothetical protein